MTDTTKLVTLLKSEDWNHVNQGFELYQSLESPDLSAALASLLPAESALADGDLELKLWAQLWEDMVESVEYTSGDETWYGGVVHGGTTSTDFCFATTDKAALEELVACIQADHWDSVGTPDDMTWELPDSVNYKDAEYYYWSADDKCIDGMPEPADEGEEVEHDHGDTIDCVYRASPYCHGFWLTELTVTDSSNQIVKIDQENIRAFLLLVALTSGVDFNALPTIDTDAIDSAIQNMREESRGNYTHVFARGT